MTETERYKAAWKTRRQRFWQYYGMLAALLGTLMVPAFLPFDPVVVGCASIAGMLGATYWLYRFRCPRCGEVFFSRWAEPFLFLSGDPLRCEHCGLSVNEIPSGPHRS